jgi:hypothetical protein
MVKIHNKINFMDIKRVTLFGLLFIITGCNGQEKKKDSNVYVLTNETGSMKTILANQLKKGKAPNDHRNYDYTQNDLDAIAPILKDILKSNGFKTISNEEFNKKIKIIFNRIIDDKSNTKFLYANFQDKCDRSIKYFPNDFAEVYGTFIIKGDNFISDFFAIPQIVDYQKYPEFKNAERDKIIVYDEIEKTEINIPHWKDIKNLSEERSKNIQVLLARNMYLFNDNKSYALWLKLHDQEFVRSLVTVFGYEEESIFNEFVIKDYLKNGVSESSKIGDVIFVRNCDKTLSIKEKLLNSHIAVFQETNDVKVLLPLKYYSSEIMELKDNVRYNWSEKVKIIAYLANTFDPNFKKYHAKQENWGDLTILADFRDFLEESDWSKVVLEYKKNNYYGLSNLKGMIDYANKFDSVGAPD